ncbi:FixH family protein [Vogesella oryzae]|uniref:FixH family protein n=1 Tax=Vogesella oryzae TaxID=1735285 RepID=UPI001FE5A634|nr:FixH family protein [Vogesella oryzae]
MPIPWYKNRWPWFLMAGPAIAVVAGIITFRLAVVTADDMVTDDYYKRGKDINLELSRDKAAVSMGIKAQAMFSDDQQSVRIITSSKQPLTGTLELQLLHPTRKQDDQTITLQRLGDNLYQGKITHYTAEHWYVRLQDKARTWRLQGEWRPQDGQSVSLGNPKLEPAE